MNVNEIINLLRSSIKKKDYDFVPTLKNRNSRRKYGLTILDIEDFLITLNSNDLVTGPEKDRDIPNDEIFVFKKKLKGIIFYVKIKKDSKIDYDRIKILSCHEDEK